MKSYKGIEFRREVKEEDIDMVKYYIDNERSFNAIIALANERDVSSKRIIGKLVYYGIYKRKETAKKEPSPTVGDTIQCIIKLLESKGIEDTDILWWLNKGKKDALIFLCEALEKLLK